jgi:alpha-N-arabinofuranosidase
VVGAAVGTPSGRILTAAAMTAHNTFEAPHTVEPAPFAGASVVGGQLSVALPPLSVVILDL